MTHRAPAASAPATRELDGRPNAHPGRARRRAGADRRIGRRASRSCCSRPTSTTPPARRSPTPSRPCSRPAPTTPGSRPIVMKKGRPAHTVSALADPALAAAGRGRADRRDRLARRAGHDARAVAAGPRRDEVEVDGLPVRVKVSRRAGQGRARRRRPRRPAAALPLREVLSLAEAEARRGGVWHGPADRPPASPSPA